MERASVELDASQFAEEALAGLSEFSHVEIIFYMDKVDPSKIEKAARHPRNNAQWPSVGIFAQRSKGRVLTIEGLDAIDGTPVLDIKPWVAEFAPRGSVLQPKWMSELMRGYWRSASC